MMPAFRMQSTVVYEEGRHAILPSGTALNPKLKNKQPLPHRKNSHSNKTGSQKSMNKDFRSIL